MSTVLPSGSAATDGAVAAAGEPAVATGASTGTATAGPGRETHRGRLDRLPAPLRVPLQLLGRTIAKAWHDRILGLSAEASFWQVLSVPPLLIGLLGSLGYLGSFIGTGRVQQIEDRLLDLSAEVLTPDVVDSLVRPTLTDILGSGRADVVSLGFVISLWAGSSATATFLNTIVIAYDQRDVRGPIRTRLMALYLFVIGLVVGVLTLPLLVLGQEYLVALLPERWQSTATLLVSAVYWPLVLIGLVLVLTSFFHVSLPRRIPWLRHLPGGVFAVGLFLVAAMLLRSYVADILTTALPYGTLATPIAVLLFCFFLGMSILLGAELNASIEARWPSGASHRQRRRLRRQAARIELDARTLAADQRRINPS